MAVSSSAFIVVAGWPGPGQRDILLDCPAGDSQHFPAFTTHTSHTHTHTPHSAFLSVCLTLLYPDHTPVTQRESLVDCLSLLLILLSWAAAVNVFIWFWVYIIVDPMTFFPRSVQSYKGNHSKCNVDIQHNMHFLYFKYKSGWHVAQNGNVWRPDCLGFTILYMRLEWTWIKWNHLWVCVIVELKKPWVGLFSTLTQHVFYQLDI